VQQNVETKFEVRILKPAYNIIRLSKLRMRWRRRGRKGYTPRME
jgi:hypothetical protein